MIDLTDQELRTAERVAVDSVRRYRDYVEHEDVRQELLLWMYQHEEKVREWRAGRGYQSLNISLRRAAKKYCEREKSQKVGYHTDDNAYYGFGTLKDYLPDAFNDYSMKHGVGVDPSSEWAISLVDIRQALRNLQPKQATLLAHAVDTRVPMPDGRFVFNYDALAELYTTEERAPTPDAIRLRVTRAIRALARSLNEPRVAPRAGRCNDSPCVHSPWYKECLPGNFGRLVQKGKMSHSVASVILAGELGS